MECVVAVRIGNLQGFFNSVATVKGKWSSPDGLESDAVREYFVQGYAVYVVFCDHSGKAIYMTRVTGVRPRSLRDYDFPLENDLGRFNTFFEFDPSMAMHIIGSPVFNRLQNAIRYTVGYQIPMDIHTTDSLIGYYKGFFDGYQSVNVPSNTYNQYANVTTSLY
jgi:hypothetical protein